MMSLLIQMNAINAPSPSTVKSYFNNNFASTASSSKLNLSSSFTIGPYTYVTPVPSHVCLFDLTIIIRFGDERKPLDPLSL